MELFMVNKINLIKEKFNNLNDELAAGFSTVEKLKEYNKLQEIIELSDRYESLVNQLSETKVMCAETTDREFKELCESEIYQLNNEIEELDFKLTDKLIEKDPNDECNAIFEIAGEVGGEEANLFARDLYEMYIRYIEKSGYKIEILDHQETDLGGFNYISFKVIGDGAYGWFKYESGVHRVQRVPETEAKGRLHTSTASVMVIPEVSVDKFELNINDIEFVACHSQGKGGQNVNKVSSAVRATYKPTGLTVFCQGERSQLQNKDDAIKMIASKLMAEKEEAEQKASSTNKSSKLGTRDRAEKIRTYNYPQNRITDHRIGLSILKLDRMMLGDLDEMIKALHIEANNERNK